ASDVDRFDALMARLADRFKPKSDAAAAAVESAAGQTERLADAIEALSPPLLKVRQSLEDTDQNRTVRGYLEHRAAMARVKADDLRTAIKSARAALARKAGVVPMPPTDEAARALREPIADAAGTTAAIGEDLRSTAMDQLAPDLKDQLSPISIEAMSLR